MRLAIGDSYDPAYILKIFLVIKRSLSEIRPPIKSDSENGRFPWLGQPMEMPTMLMRKKRRLFFLEKIVLETCRTLSGKPGPQMIQVRW